MGGASARWADRLAFWDTGLQNCSSLFETSSCPRTTESMLRATTTPLSDSLAEEVGWVKPLDPAEAWTAMQTDNKNHQVNYQREGYHVLRSHSMWIIQGQQLSKEVCCFFDVLWRVQEGVSSQGRLWPPCQGKRRNGIVWRRYPTVWPLGELIDRVHNPMVGLQAIVRFPGFHYAFHFVHLFQAIAWLDFSGFQI